MSLSCIQNGRNCCGAWECNETQLVDTRGTKPGELSSAMHTHVKALSVLAKNARASQDRADIVIVGNGIAGLSAAVEARSLAPHKRIVIVTKQSHPTINTPALKQFAIGKLMQEQLLAYPAGTERSHQIEVINASVEEIKSRGKYLRLSDGRDFGYGSLLLAKGRQPTGLPA